MTGAGRRPVDKPDVDATAADPASSPKKAAAVFSPPTWLTRRDAKEVWKRIVPELARFNIMTEVFRDVMGRYCDAFADWIKVNKDIQRQGTTMLVPMTNGKGKMRRVNPAIRVRESLEATLIDLEDRFGMSPVARYKIVSYQAAHPGQRDLFRDQAAAAGAEAGSLPPASAVPDPNRDTPIGLLN